MTEDLGALLRWAGRVCGEPVRVERLSSVLLGGGPGGETRPASVLNNDGSPLQVCMSFHGVGQRLRLIGDPAATAEEPESRFRLARRALHQVLDLTGSESLAEVCDQTLRLTLPRRKGEEFRNGAVWLAAGLDGGAALYVNMNWGLPGERWRDAASWLQALLPDSRESQAVIGAAEEYSSLASIGVEGSGSADARLKLYWRLNRSVPMERMGIPLLADVGFGGFLTQVVRQGSLSRRGLVLSASFGLSDGALRDAKVDLCAHCLPRPPERWVSVLKGCCRGLGTFSTDLEVGLLRRQCELAFIGLGVDRRRARRLNTYLKAAPSPP